MIASQYLITFSAPGIPLVRVAMGDRAPKLTGGAPNWETRDRPRLPAATIWSGRSPVTQEIPVLFSGMSDNLPVEQDCNNLDRMQRGLPPPLIRVTGAILRRDIPQWIITSISWGDNVYKEMRGGVPVRLRQDAVVNVMEYIPVSVVTPGGTQKNQGQKSSHGTPLHKTHTVRAGETLAQISMNEYGETSHWIDIKNANPAVRDPNKIAVGLVLRLPRV